MRKTERRKVRDRDKKIEREREKGTEGNWIRRKNERDKDERNFKVKVRLTINYKGRKRPY